MTGPIPPERRPAWQEQVAPVCRDQAAARATYDRLAAVYDLVEAPFERRPRTVGLRLLDPRPGQRILEIGPGTGHVLAAIARRVGAHARVVGVDLSARMLARARGRLTRSGAAAGVALVQGEACRLPLPDACMDAVIMGFVLDLVDTGDIPQVLAECRRVLRPTGRLVVVALDLGSPPTTMTKLYLWAHRRLPRLLDCRPLPVVDLLTAAGWRVRVAEHPSAVVLPAVAVLAEPGG